MLRFIKIKPFSLPYFNLAAGIIITTVLLSTSIVLGQENENIPELTKGKELLRLEQYEKALPYFDTVLEKDPTNLDALLAKSTIHLLNKEFEEASSTLDKILELNPNDVEALNLKMIATGGLGKSQEAGTYLVRISQLNQKVQVLTSQGFQHYLKDEFNDALSYFDEALEINPKHAKAVAGKALALFQLGKFEDAINNIDKAALLAPNDQNIQRDQMQMILSLPRDSYFNGSSLKLLMRDSNGGLIGYQEAFGLGVFLHNYTEQFLDSMELKTELAQEGQNYEVLQFRGEFPVTIAETFSQAYVANTINGTEMPNIFTLHHGVPSQLGSTVYELWTLVRPIG